MKVTLQFIGVLLFGVLCLAIGVVATIDGDIAALGMFGFGVVCLAGAFMTREPKAPEEPLRTGSITSRGRTFSGLIITFSRRRAVLAVIIGIGFVATGVWIIIDEALLPGILVTSLFALFTVFGVVGLAKGAGVLVLTEDEVVHAAAGGRASIRWEDVTSVERYSIRGTPFLRIGSAAGADIAGGLAQGLSMIMRRSDLEIPLSAVGVDPDWLEELIRRCAKDPEERRRAAAGSPPPH